MVCRFVRIVFKSWFVDYEFPDGDGRPYKSSGGEMDYSDDLGGDVPTEWKLEKMDRHVDVVKGCSYKSDDLQKSGTSLVTLKSINRGGGFNQNGYKEYVGMYNKDQVLGDGEIIVAQTDLTQKAEVIGRPAIVDSLGRYDVLIASLDLQIVRPKNNFFKNYVFYLLQMEEFHNHALSYTNGTTVLHLGKNAIHEFNAVIPTQDVLNKFDDLVKPLLARVSINKREAKSLVNLRDALLPKLMSGRMRIPARARKK